MKRRLFVAIALDEVARDACARVAERLRAKGWTARWVPPPNYHLTVAFLGAVEVERVDAVIAALRAVARSIEPFVVPLDAVGAFPNRRKPRVAWMGASADVAAFRTAFGVVRSSLAAQGFAFDTHADAHVTLARADATAPLPAVNPPDGVRVHVEALNLFDSVTASTGARYTALERFPLAGS